jgi:ketosteroid isomerase-like protein
MFACLFAWGKLGRFGSTLNATRGAADTGRAMSPAQVVRQPCPLRGDSRRRLDLWVALRFSRLGALAIRMLVCLPVSSRIRQGLMWRAVRLGYEVFNVTGQINVHLLTPDAVLIQPGSELGNEGVFHGREGFVRGGRELQEVFGDFRMQPEELIDLGDRLLVFVRLRGRAKMSGIPLNEPMTHVYSYRGGRIAEMHVYVDRNEALKAVGLGE